MTSVASCCTIGLVILQDELAKLDDIIKKESGLLDELVSQITLQRARLAGLKEQRRTLAAAMPVGAPGGQRGSSVLNDDITKLTMTDAIKEVVNSAGRAMRISDVVRELKERGRNDNPNSVSVTLNYLANAGDIGKVGRGIYGPAAEGASE